MSFRAPYHLNENEEIVKVIRQYPLMLVWRQLPPAVAIFGAVFLFAQFSRLGKFGLALFLFLLLTAVAAASHRFFCWFATIIIVTDRRIIDIDQKNLLDRVVSEVALSKIQDVSYRNKGIFEALFNYGTVIVQTVGTNVRFTFRNIRNPIELKDLLTALQDESVNNTANKIPHDMRSKVLRDMAELNEESLRRVALFTEQEARERAIKESFLPDDK